MAKHRPTMKIRLIGFRSARIKAVVSYFFVVLLLFFSGRNVLSSGSLLLEIDSSIQQIVLTSISGPSQREEWYQRSKGEVKLFRWKCWDNCSCLPPQFNSDLNETVMHQSFKTSNDTTWHNGWKYQRQTWIDLHPDWNFIFWTDDQNELLAKCIGFPNLLQGRKGIQKADLSRLLYLSHYGGFYADMDYIAVQNHDFLFSHIFRDQSTLLQGRFLQPVGLEWGYAREPNNPFWKFCLGIANLHKSSERTGCPIWNTGPKFLQRCIKRYFKMRQKLNHMVSYRQANSQERNSLMILEPSLVAPIAAFDFTSVCGRWRNMSHLENAHKELWKDAWPVSQCREQLMQNGSYAVTVYSHSWGDGLKC